MKRVNHPVHPLQPLHPLPPKNGRDVLSILSFLVGFVIVNFTISSAVRTFVLPRSAPDKLNAFLFRTWRRVFNLVLMRIERYETRDSIMALYAPIALMTLTPVWLFLITIGYAFMFWALGAEGWLKALSLSGSSLLTLGVTPPEGLWQTLLTFFEAATGMIMVALLIAYLPTIYATFQWRELLVTALATRAGEPPWGVTLLDRAYLVSRMGALHELWVEWESWFVDMEESHTSLGSTLFFRSQNPSRSWIIAAGAILDAAALYRAAVDLDPDPAADLMIRAGYLALRSIAKPFGFKIIDDPRFPDQPISVTRAEFDAACDQLRASGVPLKLDAQQSWLDYAGWRVNYDQTLLDLCDLIMAPEAPWSSDRSSGRWHLSPRFATPNRVRDPDLIYRAKKEAELPNVERHE